VSQPIDITKYIMYWQENTTLISVRNFLFFGIEGLGTEPCVNMPDLYQSAISNFFKVTFRF